MTRQFKPGQPITFFHLGAERAGVVLAVSQGSVLAQYTAQTGQSVTPILKTSEIARRRR